MINFLKPYTAYLIVAAVALALITGFTAGWKINGWRLGKDLATAQGQVVVLSQSINTQNKAIEALDALTKEAEKKRAEADKQVVKLKIASDAKIKSLKERDAFFNTCEAELEELGKMLEWAR